MANDKEVHDFIDYSHAKKVVKDFPAMIFLFKKLLPALYEKRHYTAVWNAIQAIEDSKMMMEMQLDYYQKIYDKKGKVSNEHK